MSKIEKILIVYCIIAIVIVAMLGISLPIICKRPEVVDSKPDATINIHIEYSVASSSDNVKEITPVESDTAGIVTQTVNVSIPCIPVDEPEPEPAESPYSDIVLTDLERQLLAAMVYQEARGESAEGQQAVAEVCLNRVLSDQFPDTVYDVLYQSGQFSTAALLAGTSPAADFYAVVDAALSGTSPVLSTDVLFFSRGAYNSNIAAVIGNHIFCRL